MKALFFDLDGTLIDSRRDLVNTVNATRADLGLAPLSDEGVMAAVGNGARYLLEHSIPEAAGRFDEVWALHRRNYEANMLCEVKLYPGVRQTLENLAGKGWKFGVVTNKPNWAVVKVLEHLGVLEMFGAIVAGGDTEKMKPAPEPLWECIGRLGDCLISGLSDFRRLPPPAQNKPQSSNQTITQSDNHPIFMVGDNWTDIACGAAAGAKTVFCRYGFGVLRDTKPDFFIDSFSELEAIAGS